MRAICTLALNLLVFACLEAQKIGDLEKVAELDIRPGNVTASQDGRVFTTIHPLVSPDIQLVEITGVNSYKAFPNDAMQNATGKPSADQFDTPLGIVIDKDNVLWTIDIGLNLGITRLFAFDIDTSKEVFRLDFPKDITPPGSFVQDLAVDKTNGWVYLADIANPGILAVDINAKTFRRFSDQSVQSENIDMMIDGKIVHFDGSPARVAINPITLSGDNETLYYGAMNGTTWYQVPARMFRQGASDHIISKAVKVAGPKPVSDGASTDGEGNHYFTNLQNGGIDVLTKEGELKPLVRGEMISWPDNAHFGPDSWLFFTVNQLHKTPAFTGGDDEGKPPYFILKVYTGAKGIAGR